MLWDAVSTIGGWAVLFSQAGIGFPPPAQTSEMLIIGSLVLIGSPGVTNLLAFRFGGTASPPPVSAESGSSLPPSSSTGSGDSRP